MSSRKQKTLFGVIGRPLIENDVSQLIGLKKRKLETAPMIESTPELDITDVEAVKNAVFHNKGLAPPISDLAKHDSVVYGRDPTQSELDDIKFYAEDKNVQKLTEKILQLTRSAPLVKPKQLSEKELQALEVQKRRQARVQSAKVIFSEEN
jgi:hypothetical protein